MIKVKLEIDALYLFELKDVNRNDFDFWEQLRHHFLQPDTTFSQELDLRGTCSIEYTSRFSRIKPIMSSFCSMMHYLPLPTVLFIQVYLLMNY